MNPHLYPRRCAVMRAAGQVGQVLSTAVALGWIYHLIRACTAIDDACEGFTPVEWLISPGSYLLTITLSLGLLWASGRASRARLAITLGALQLVVWLVRPVLVIAASITSSDAAWRFIASYAVFDLPAVGATALLLASYRAPASARQAEEHGVMGLRSPWLWLVLPTVLLAHLLGQSAVTSLGLHQVADLLVMLIAAAAYRLMRQIWPLAGAGSWLSVAVVLTGLTLPAYLWMALDPTYHLDDRYAGVATATGCAVVCALATATVAALAALAFWRHRRPPTEVSTELTPTDSGEAEEVTR